MSEEENQKGPRSQPDLAYQSFSAHMQAASKHVHFSGQQDRSLSFAGRFRENPTALFPSDSVASLALSSNVR